MDVSCEQYGKQRWLMLVMVRKCGSCDPFVFYYPGGRFTGLYGHLEKQHRHYMWELLRRLYNHDGSAQVIGGDLNESLNDSEKWGDNLQNQWLINNFREALMIVT